MYAAIFPSDMPQSIHPALASVRVDGGANIRFRARADRTHLADLSETDGYKVRFPNAGGAAEAVIINTGGGVAGGDHIRISATAEDSARATISTPSAERIYGALAGSTTQIKICLTLGENARLNWLPQETILFDKAHIERSLSVDMAATAAALICETVIFGRAAMGEIVSNASYMDRWRIRRGGKLIFAENAKLDGDIARLLAKAAIAGKAIVISTTLHVAPDAEDRLPAVRDILSTVDANAAASAWNGMLVVRALAQDSQSIRILLTRLLPLLSGNNLPRGWSS
ncbi:MAG: urease accessory protein UreD [Hyphomicrobiales bacterium]|nr:urease accessory protein UreD [Hyphomicrobiales bacterium]